jgi:SAM-dependent methyltransferase
MSSSTIVACRSCASADLVPILSLGCTPLANSLLTREQISQPETTYPLELIFCSDCALLQLTETVSPELLFRDYLYFSSFSETFLDHARTIVERITRSRILDANNRVIEVASNDGYLLQFYKDAGIDVLGIEPARNIARVAEEQRQIPTISEFFGSKLAARLKAEQKQADVIHANNVLAHVSDLNDFVGGLALLLKDEGVAIIEVPYVRELIEHCEFDTVYHEHLSYFSLTSLTSLFERHGLRIVDVECLAIHGGSLRLFLQKVAEASTVSRVVQNLLNQEKKLGMDKAEFYLEFKKRVEGLRKDLLTLLQRLKTEGATIAAYGASAKGSTLLNYFGIGSNFLDFVVDRSTVKQGLFTPGTHLPIYGPEKLLELKPDNVLLLTWNFADEILTQQKEYRRRGGRFIVPIPSVVVI